MAKSKIKMTGRERIQALYDRKPTDTVAYIHRGYGFCAKNVGFPLADIYENPEKSYEAQVRTIEQYDSDGSPFYTFVSYGAWEFGGTIEWPDDRWGSGPGVETRPISSAEEVFDLQLPDVTSAGAIPHMMAFAKLQEQHGDPIAFICGSPFTFSANLCGVQEFLTWTAEAPDAVHHVMRLMTDHLLEVAEYFIGTFGKGKCIARSAAPTDGLVSPKMFKEYIQPYLIELHTKILEMGAHSIYCHICGEQNHVLELWKEVPFGDPGMLSFGHEVDLLRAAEVFPEHIIAGNVEPAIVARGEPEEIYEQCRIAIEKGKQCPSGFVLMGGCELPASTPPFHIYLMSKARQEFGIF